MEYLEIGKVLGVSKERVHQLLVSSMRHMRTYDPAHALAYGAEFIEKRNSLASRRIEMNEELQRLAEALASKGRLTEKLKQAIQDSTDSAAESSVPLSAVPLSTRSYKCLTRAGYRCIGELQGMTEKQLLKLSCLGRSSVREIAEAAAKYGVYIVTAPERNHRDRPCTGQ